MKKGSGNARLWTTRKTKSRFPAPPTSPWKSLARFPHSRSPGHGREGKWKSKTGIPTLPRSFRASKTNTKGALNSGLLPLGFRLISGLEKASRAVVRPRPPAVLTAGYHEACILW